MLVPIFNNHILEDNWKEHLERITDFWVTNLFGVAKYKGSPTHKHINVEKNHNYRIEQNTLGSVYNFGLKLLKTYLQENMHTKLKILQEKCQQVNF